MTEEIFQLKEGSEFIELNKLLKYTQIAQTGGHARLLIENGEVIVNDEVESRIRRKLRPGDAVECMDHKIIIEA